MLSSALHERANTLEHTFSLLKEKGARSLAESAQSRARLSEQLEAALNRSEAEARARAEAAARAEEEEAAAVGAADALALEQTVSKTLRSKVQELQELYDEAVRTSVYYQREHKDLEATAAAGEKAAGEIASDRKRLRVQVQVQQQALSRHEEKERAHEQYRAELTGKRTKSLNTALIQP